MQRELSTEKIKKCIYLVRNQRVILDSDLANFYQIPTKRLNEQVKRNSIRFPSDFMFQLDAEEYKALKSQFPTVSEYGGRRYLPHLFSEHGAIMVASILNTEHAVTVSIEIVRAFIQTRESSSTEKSVDQRLFLLESQMAELRKTISDQSHSTTKPSTNPNFHGKKLVHNEVEKIQRIVADYYQLSVKKLTMPTRTKAVTLPRQIAMYLIRKRTQLSYKEIGNHFGGKDHTTILHGCQKIEVMVTKDPEFRNNLQIIETFL